MSLRDDTDRAAAAVLKGKGRSYALHLCASLRRVTNEDTGPSKSTNSDGTHCVVCGMGLSSRAIERGSRLCVECRGKR